LVGSNIPKAHAAVQHRFVTGTTFLIPISKVIGLSTRRSQWFSGPIHEPSKSPVMGRSTLFIP
jgi:hypothetical protein